MADKSMQGNLDVYAEIKNSLSVRGTKTGKTVNLLGARFTIYAVDL